jgi:hypothetical protein
MRAGAGAVSGSASWSRPDTLVDEMGFEGTPEVLGLNIWRFHRRSPDFRFSLAEIGLKSEYLVSTCVGSNVDIWLSGTTKNQ